MTNEYSSILAGHSLQLGSDSLNEFLFQYTKFDNVIIGRLHRPVRSTSPRARTRGQNINTPQTTDQTKYQYKDDFSFTRTLGGRANNFKVGVNYIHEPILGGDFSTGTDRPVLLHRQQPEFAGHADHLQRRLLRRVDARRPVQRLLPGRHPGQRPADPQPRPPLRLLGRLRPRPAHQPDLADALHPDPLQRVLPARLPGRPRRPARERRQQLGPAARLHLRPQGRRPAAAARRLRHLLRLPLHQRHHPLPGGGRAVQLRHHLQPRQPGRHPQRRRQLLPPGRSAASEPAPRRGHSAAERGRLADAGDPVLLPGFARLLLAGQQLARPELRGGDDRLPRHPVPLPGQPHRPGHGRAPLPGLRQLPPLVRQRRGRL